MQCFPSNQGNSNCHNSKEYPPTSRKIDFELTMFSSKAVSHLARHAARASGKTAFRALGTARFAPSVMASAAVSVPKMLCENCQSEADHAQ
jgi:hypothetical protein